MLEVGKRRIAGDHHVFDDATGDVLVDPFAHLEGGEYRPQPLHHRERHAGAGDAESKMRLGAGIIEAAGHGDADIVGRPRVDAAEIALHEFDAFVSGIDAQPRRSPVQRKSLVIAGWSKDDRVDDGVLAGDVGEPSPVPVRRRFHRRAHGELVAGGMDLEGNNQQAMLGIPGKAQFGAVDVDVNVAVGAVDDAAAFRKQLPLHQSRRAVGSNFRAHACR